MSKLKTIQALLFISSLIFIISCSHYDSLEKNGVESTASRKSHNSGQDCMSCHNRSSNEASSKAWWNVAGTVYDGADNLNPSARIELWSEPNAKGFKILSLVADKDANFYSEKIINFKGGCYPIAISRNGADTAFMSGSFNGTGCNGCHGVSTSVIRIN